MVRVAYKYRIYPNNEQKIYFAKCFGCVRFFYNKSLLDMNDIYKTTGISKNITPAFYKEEYTFLKEVDSCALRCAVFNLEDSFKNFFERMKRNETKGFKIVEPTMCNGVDDVSNKRWLCSKCSRSNLYC